MVALELWDAESAHALATRQVRFASETGALVHLQFALRLLALTHFPAGELTDIALLLDEDRLITEATRNPSLPTLELTLAAWRGDEPRALELIAASVPEATSGGMRGTVSLADLASSVLYNGLGRHDAACDAAWRAFERGEFAQGRLSFPSWRRARPGPAT
jgi:hypothetical protein